jgi:hypothetical protein
MRFAILAFIITAIPAIPVYAAEEKKPAAKNEKGGKPAEKKAPAVKKPVTRTDMVDEDAIKLLQPFDKNSDHQIDPDEFEAVAAEFKKNPRGPLAAFDKGKDGELDGLIDRTGMNVKLGAAAKPAPAKPAVKKPAPKPKAPPAAPPAEQKKPA